MLYSSIENKKIKDIKKLYTKKYRDSNNLFIVEGEHLVIEAYKNNVLEELILEENIKGILVVEPQRVSRGDMSDCGRVVNILKYSNTLCITVTKTYDLNNKFDKELFEAQLLQGNKYLEYHK